MSASKSYSPRDIEKQPYTVDEERAATFFVERGVGGGDDPIGALLAGYSNLVAERNAAKLERDAFVMKALTLTCERNQARAECDSLALQVLTLTNERDEARALGRIA